MAIKLRTIIKHPAQVVAGAGLAVDKENGVYTFLLDLAALSETSLIADAAATSVLLVTPGSGDATPDVTERMPVDELLALAANFDAELKAIAGLASAADKLPYFTGPGTAALADFTAFGRSLVDDATAGAALTTLGVSAFAQTMLDDANAAAVRTTIGAQASDAELTALAGLSSAADKLPYFTGPGAAALADVTAFARSLLDDASNGDARATLSAASIGTTMTAGAGLTGGGDLSANRTFAVGAGAGIAVNADDVTLGPQPAYTVMVNAAGSAAAPTGVKISALTDRTGFGAGDKLMIEESSGELRKVDYTDLPGSGSLGGSTGAADNALVRADGTGGATVQPTGIIVDDANNVSGINNLAALGASMVLLSSATASASAQVDLETGFGTTYDNYVVIFDSLVVATDTFLHARVRVSGAYITSGEYNYVLNALTPPSTTSAGGSTGQTSAIIINNVGGASNESADGKIDIYAANSSRYKRFRVESMSTKDDGVFRIEQGGFSVHTTGAVQGIRIFPNAGSITSGNFYLYGIRKS